MVLGLLMWAARLVESGVVVGSCRSAGFGGLGKGFADLDKPLPSKVISTCIGLINSFRSIVYLMHPLSPRILQAH